ncbi:hypothetical protein C8J57DRAFT_1527414 [Mycena rebaudengoi]|nr:hypothetical protein C8J57DRAFT_1534288 [Mycena rebaudengoi]KAJ7240747.1 hypothetical protein C8J57DRAFT_1527414 [Mycena rebaudengoi]
MRLPYLLYIVSSFTPSRSAVPTALFASPTSASTSSAAASASTAASAAVSTLLLDQLAVELYQQLLEVDETFPSLLGASIFARLGEDENRLVVTTEMRSTSPLDLDFGQRQGSGDKGRGCNAKYAFFSSMIFLGMCINLA